MFFYLLGRIATSRYKFLHYIIRLSYSKGQHQRHELNKRDYNNFVGEWFLDMSKSKQVGIIMMYLVAFLERVDT